MKDHAGNPSQLRRVAVAGMLGSALEYYDFLLAAAFSALIFNKLFFPNFSPQVGTIAAFGTYAVGYISRPLGGLIFGHFGDRLGRKSMLLWTMSIMGLASFLIGLLPTYFTIGFWAPALLVLLRVLQGVAVGGELGGAILMTAEHSSRHRRGMWISLTVAGAPLGSLLSTVAVLIVTLLPERQFMSWGWRIPFLFSIALLGVGLFMRVRVSESPQFSQVKKMRNELRLPVWQVVRHPHSLATAAGSGLLPLVIQSLWSTFVISYAVSNGHSKSIVLLGLALGSALQLITIPAIATLSDRIGRRPVMFFGAVATMAMTFPLFWMIDSKSTFWLLTSLLIGRCVLQALVYAPWCAWLPENFPTPVRYTGASLAYQIGTLVGGFAPVIASTLILASHGNVNSVALFVAGCSVITITALCFIRESS